MLPIMPFLGVFDFRTDLLKLTKPISTRRKHLILAENLPCARKPSQRCGIPPTVQRNRKLATSYELYNAESFNSHRLPLELVPGIVRHLCTVDALAFKLTCLRYGHVDTREASHAERKDLIRRLRRDAFPAPAAAEPYSFALL